MGGMIFDPESLADSLSETAGYKAGLALSVDELCDHLSGTDYPDIIRASETHVVRLRSEEYEELFYKLLYRIGHTPEEYDGDITGAKLFHKYKTSAQTEWAGVTELFIEMWPKLMDEAAAKGTKLVDPRPFIQASVDKFGRIGLDIALERLEVLARALNLSPHSIVRYTEWRAPLALSALFKGGSGEPEYGRYIDQRFIDYLSKNQGQLSAVHWRKFEELTAEFFHREGYEVQLGPGSNDDGVDVRIWKPGQSASDNPHCVVQCKRQKEKIERVVVKGLHADASFEGAEYGLIVTTSELSPGARRTIAARGYPIREINRAGLNEWLEKLRTPGTGIVRV
jgi:restriction system protein